MHGPSNVDVCPDAYDKLHCTPRNLKWTHLLIMTLQSVPKALSIDCMVFPKIQFSVNLSESPYNSVSIALENVSAD